MWIKLLQRESIGQMVKPQFVGGVWRKPIIQARQRKELQNYFEMAGVPWVYNKERPEVHSESAYNRRPKGTKFSNNYETRLATIRKNVSLQPEKLHKLRVDTHTNKDRSENEMVWLGVLKALQSEAGASKHRKSSTSAKKGKSSAGGDDFVEKRKGSPVKKQLGASKGGQISKKEREVMGMAKGLVDGEKKEEE